jgi:tyrosinase
VTDVVMKLFGPDSQTEFVAEDDDSGPGTNPRISADLLPGTYYVQVRHFDPSSTGNYQIKVYS